MDNPLYLLRLKSAELIFSGELPLVVAAREINEPDATIVKAEPVTNPAPKISKPAKAKNVAVMKQPQRADNPASVVPEVSPPEPAHDPSALPDPLLTESAPGISNSQGAKDMNTLPSDPDQGLSESKSTDDAPSLCQTKQQKNETPAQPTNTEKSALAANPNLSTTDTKSIANPADSAQCWLENHGDAGQWLMDIASMLNQGQWQLGSDLLEVQDKYLLPFPATAEKLAIEPPQFIKILEETGWLVTDVLSPMRKVQTIQSVRGVLLALEPSSALKALLKSQGEATSTASSIHSPNSNTDKTGDQVKSSQTQDAAPQKPKPVQPKSKSTGNQKSISGKASDSSVYSEPDKASDPVTTPPAKTGTIDLLITHVRQQLDTQAQTLHQQAGQLADAEKQRADQQAIMEEQQQRWQQQQVQEQVWFTRRISEEKQFAEEKFQDRLQLQGQQIALLTESEASLRQTCTRLKQELRRQEAALAESRQKSLQPYKFKDKANKKSVKRTGGVGGQSILLSTYADFCWRC